MRPLSELLAALDLGAPITSANLTMVPLLAPAPAEPEYLLLDDALEAGLAEVTEVSQSGAVPEVAFRNKADRDILLVDGEELVGAKQNRVLNLTLLVAAGQQVTIPVSCVEAGRWAWRSQRFAAGKRKLHARARAAKMRGVSASLREDGRRARGDIQAAIWRSVDDKLDFLRVESATRALHDALDAAEPRLAAIRADFAPQYNQVGAVFSIDGQPVGLDLFDAPATLAKMLPKLVDSYAIDALETSGAAAEAPSLAAVRELLARIARAPAVAYPALAKGTDVRIEDGALHAAALVAGGRVLHLAAFECGDVR